MSEISTSRELPVIEVPVELRGPSDEEILNMESCDDTPRKRRAARRLSKRERMAKKLGKGLSQMHEIVKTVESRNESAKTVKNAVPHRPVKPFPEFEMRETRANVSEARKKLDALFAKPAEKPVEKAEPKVAKTLISETPRPTSGRVLKGSFGAKPSEHKAEIVSAAELMKRRLEERAKKIRDALFAKNHPEATAPAMNPDGTPVKRPRGRPRKNPIV